MKARPAKVMVAPTPYLNYKTELGRKNDVEASSSENEKSLRLAEWREQNENGEKTKKTKRWEWGWTARNSIARQKVE